MTSRKRFPHAHLVIENRAIGGFASQRLIKPAEHDLYPFYPDLLIFHVYGANQEYEQIIKNVRSRTTAEVLMQLDHVAAAGWQDAAGPEGRQGALVGLDDEPRAAPKHREEVWLRGRGRAHAVDRRTSRRTTTSRSNCSRTAFTSTRRGTTCWRRSSIAISSIAPSSPSSPETVVANEAIKTIDVGKDVQWKDGKLELAFEGNRVDAIARPEGGNGKAQVLIDGKCPGEIPSCYAIPRPQPGPFSPLWVYRIDHEVPFTEEEDWTLTIKSFDLNGAGNGIVYDGDAATWTYEVTGSRTGPDGEGQSDQPFVSNSKKVKIEPKTWLRNGKVPVGYQIKWKVTLMGTDAYEAKPAKDATIENATVLRKGWRTGSTC